MIEDVPTKSLAPEGRCLPLPQGTRNIRTIFHYLLTPFLTKAKAKPSQARPDLAESRKEPVWKQVTSDKTIRPESTTFDLPHVSELTRRLPENKKAKAVQVGMNEIKGAKGVELDEWLKSLRSEFDSFTRSKALTEVTPAIDRKCREKGIWPIPMQVVATRKPISPTEQKEKGLAQPWKKKSRFVICGNLGGTDEGTLTSTTNADAAVIRMFLSFAAGKGNTISGTDISTAFLNAPIDPESTIMIQPPKVLEDLGIVAKGT